MDTVIPRATKNNYYNLMAQAYISVLEKQEIMNSDRRNISLQIFELFENNLTYEKLIDFLVTTFKKYRIFAQLLSDIKTNYDKIKEQVVVNKLHNYMQNSTK